MTVELIIARGWRIWIDGKTTQGEWEIGEDMEQGHGVYSLGQDGEPLKVGDELVTAVTFDVPEAEWSSDNKPTRVIVQDERGTPRFFEVTQVAYGEEDAAVKVKLVNGETVELDEITTYIRAEN